MISIAKAVGTGVASASIFVPDKRLSIVLASSEEEAKQFFGVRDQVFVKECKWETKDTEKDKWDNFSSFGLVTFEGDPVGAVRLIHNAQSLPSWGLRNLLSVPRGMEVWNTGELSRFCYSKEWIACFDRPARRVLSEQLKAHLLKASLELTAKAGIQYWIMLVKSCFRDSLAVKMGGILSVVGNPVEHKGTRLPCCAHVRTYSEMMWQQEEYRHLWEFLTDNGTLMSRIPSD